MSNQPNQIESKAEVLYTTYCGAVGGKAFNGDPLPDWKDFASDPKKQVQADAWRIVARLALRP